MPRPKPQPISAVLKLPVPEAPTPLVLEIRELQVQDLAIKNRQLILASELQQLRGQGAMVQKKLADKFAEATKLGGDTHQIDPSTLKFSQKKATPPAVPPSSTDRPSPERK